MLCKNKDLQQKKKLTNQPANTKFIDFFNNIEVHNKRFSSIVWIIIFELNNHNNKQTKRKKKHFTNDNGDDSIKCGFRLKIPDEKPQQQTNETEKIIFNALCEPEFIS